MRMRFKFPTPAVTTCHLSLFCVLDILWVPLTPVTRMHGDSTAFFDIATELLFHDMAVVQLLFVGAARLRTAMQKPLAPAAAPEPLAQARTCTAGAFAAPSAHTAFFAPALGAAAPAHQSSR